MHAHASLPIPGAFTLEAAGLSLLPRFLPCRTDRATSGARLVSLGALTCHWSFIQLRPEPVADLIRPPTLDRPEAEFSGFAQGDGLVTPPDFASMIGTLLPIAPCGRSSL